MLPKTGPVSSPPRSSFQHTRSSSSCAVRDAPLTFHGRQQSAALNQSTKDTIQATADLLVTSGLRRTLSTTVIGNADLRKRLETEGKPVIVLPQLQEVNDLPCDTGSVRPSPPTSRSQNPEHISPSRSHLALARDPTPGR